MRGRLSASLRSGWAAQPMEPTTLGTGLSQALGYAYHPPLLVLLSIYLGRIYKVQQSRGTRGLA